MSARARRSRRPRSLDRTLKGELKTGADREAAQRVGLLLAERAKAAGVEAVSSIAADIAYTDGFKALAEGAREGVWRCRPRSEMGRHSGRGERSDDREQGELVDRLVSVDPVAKVVKGGRRFGFSALVVVGDGKGRVGFGSGKAREVPEAVRKATDQAKRSIVRMPLRQGRTLHHDILGRFGSGYVLMRAAPPGTGIIAGGPMRSVFQALGIHDVVGEVAGLVQPAQYGEGDLRCARARGDVTPRSVAAKRGKKVSGYLIGRRETDGGRAAAEGGGLEPWPPSSS